MQKNPRLPACGRQAPCSVEGSNKANLCYPNRPRPILVERRGFARAGDNRKLQNAYPD